MSNQHTKGPWRVNIWDYPSANPPRKDLVIENSTNRIAVLDWDQGLDNPYTIKNDEAQANARLISAAPDMYEALKQAYTLIGEDLIDNSIDEKYTELHNLIGKAIEKAEGGNEE